MLFFNGALALVFFAVWIFCIIDVITTPEDECRNLPKFAWLLIVILLVDVGAIVWLVAGKTWNSQRGDLPARDARRRVPQRTRQPARTMSPDDDEEFLAGLRARAEEQRRRAREAQQRDEPPSGDTSAS